MPNNFDFSKLENVQKVEVNPEGWINPLYVEYSIGEHGGVPSYYWRVKGTKHTFVIPLVRMQYLSSGDYVKHFEMALEAFREDYKGWGEEGFYADWMQEYREQYRRFISL